MNERPAPRFDEPPFSAHSQAGDVDQNGDIIDSALRRRLREAIVTAANVDPDAHLEAIAGVVSRIRRIGAT